MAQELIAQGVEPLQAFTQAGFAYPAREVKRQAGAVAEAQGKDPLAVLEQVARYGAPADAVNACGVLLALGDDAPGIGSKMLVVEWVRPEPRGDVAAPPPSFNKPDGMIAEAEVLEGERIYNSVDEIIEAYYSAAATAESTSQSLASFARARLRALLMDSSVKDQQLVSAAKALLRETPKRKPTPTAERTLFVVPYNYRGPVGPHEYFFVRAPSAQTVQENR